MSNKSFKPAKLLKQNPTHKFISGSAQINPNNLEALFREGLQEHNLGKLVEAKNIYAQVLKSNPIHFNALQLSAAIATQTKQWSLALELYDKALAIDQSSAVVFYNQGNTLQNVNRFEDAVTSYNKAIALKDDYVDAFCNLGNALQAIKQYSKALEQYDKAIELDPSFVGAYVNRGLVLQELQFMADSLACYERAIELQPDYAEAYTNRGAVLRELKQFYESLLSSSIAIKLNANNPNAYLNCGNTLRELQHLDEALSCYSKALELNPNFAMAYFNQGIVLHETKRIDEALKNYESAIELSPDYAQAHNNKSLSHLLKGDFNLGLPEYEWRWINDPTLKDKEESLSKIPRWQGHESLANKTILIYSEQGLGDTIQFCRFARLIADLGAKVILEVQKPLQSLLQNISGVHQVVTSLSDLHGIDYQCPLMSLPLALRTTTAKVPQFSAYIQCDPEKVNFWKSRLGVQRKPRIGIAWSSTSKFKKDKDRSISFLQMLSALPVDKFDIYCLQQEIKEQDKSDFENNGFIFFGNDLKDFSDTAALINCMDLVVSTCTSIPHLSAALGKPTWIMLQYVPDWRWMLDKKDSPWYPSVKLYRQHARGEWDSVLRSVRDDLTNFIGHDF